MDGDPNTMNLYEITEQHLQLVAMLEAGDIDQQTFDDTLAGMEGDLETKLEGCVYVMRNAESDAEKFKAESKFFADKAKAVQKLADFMEQRIKGAMIALDRPKVQTNRFTLTVGKAGAAPLEILDPKVIPIQYMKEMEPTWDKTAIKAALAAGEDVPGVKLGEQTEVLRIK
jgi:hypothetical protein